MPFACCEPIKIELKTPGKIQTETQKKSKRDIRIYVAGKIQGSTLLESLKNINEGQDFTAMIFKLGYSPYPVFTDMEFLMRVSPAPSIEEVYAYSRTWLKASDVMIVIPGWEKSVGVAKEIECAKENDTPVFFTVEMLDAWYNLKFGE